MRVTSKAIAAAMIWWSSCAGAAAQSDAAPTPAAEADDAKSDFAESIQPYKLAFPDDPAAPIVRADKPLLLWSNPIRKTTAGAVYLFTSDGRPQAAVCIYPTPDGLDHEWHSLAERPIIAQRDGVIVWQPATGIERHPLSQTRPPAASPTVRLREMRSLARRFEAQITPPNKSPSPLRLLAAPLYRDPPAAEGGEVIDGAIFAFVLGTDPEVLLRIEARDRAADASERGGPGEPSAQWFYSLARMSMVPMQVKLDDQVAWSTGWSRRDPTQTYHTITDLRR